MTRSHRLLDNNIDRNRYASMVLYRLYANERVLFLTLPLFSSVVLASSKVEMGVVAHRRAIPQRACLAPM